MKSVIIDDEKHCIERLSDLIDQHCPQIELMASSQQPREGLKIIQNLKPDLVFLDIQMPGMTGFGLLDELRSTQTQFEVIFTTSYSHYADKAFRVSALDYLLKPIDGQELKEAVEKGHQRLGHGSFNEFTQNRLHTFLGHMDEKAQKKRIVLTQKHTFFVVEIQQIAFCESTRNTTQFVLKEPINGTQEISMPMRLAQAQEMLEAYGFMRIHQSFLINLNELVAYQRGDGGTVQLSTGHSLPVARAKKDQILQLFEPGAS